MLVAVPVMTAFDAEPSQVWRYIQAGQEVLTRVEVDLPQLDEGL